MLTNLYKTPWPFFGGKADAAEAVWGALGDCAHYVEPFAGSLAVLLRRPHLANRAYFSETVNDVDGLLVNAWRSIQLSPDETAAAASNPVAEADLHARHLALVRWREERNLELLMGDPNWHDPVMGGWWIWGCSCWIGGGWCAGTGPWSADASGRFVKTAASGVARQRPHLGDNGEGVNHAGAREPGIGRQRPHLGNDGEGVNHAGAREPGVSRRRPHIVSQGQGVNHPGAREPGVDRKLPRLGNDGQGVNRPQAREPGVDRQRPHLSSQGRGVNHAGAREPGVGRQRPFLGADGQGVNHPQAREPGTGDNPYHPVTMPEVVRWMRYLSARLRHVRVLNGDWERCLTGGASKTLPVRMSGGVCGVFLDPPYGARAIRGKNLYVHDSETVAVDVMAWCVRHGDDPDYRIVLAGFEGEHEELIAQGWRAVQWFKAGFLKGGMKQGSSAGHQQHRERLWISPHCLGASESQQRGLFDEKKSTPEMEVVHES